jgi:hypothetical protein
MTLFVRALLVLLIFCAVAQANPNPVTMDVYIASEHLEIRLNRNDAELRGTFTFHMTSESTDMGPKFPWDLDLPVWFPRRNASDPRVAHFWRNARQQGALSEAIQLVLRPGNRTIMPGSLAGFQDEIPPAWKHPDFSCLKVSYSLPGAIIEHGTPVKVSWHQPYSAPAGAEKTFFYVPLFKNVPRFTATESSSLYSILITTHPAVSATVMNGATKSQLSGGQTLRIQPRHERAIRAVVNP